MGAPASPSSSSAAWRAGSSRSRRARSSRCEGSRHVQEALATYLTGLFDAPVSVIALRPLGEPDAAGGDPKGFGYGVPFEVECGVNGSVRKLVVSRTRVAQGFGHDYPADRAWQALYGHTAYNSFPSHVKSL